MLFWNHHNPFKKTIQWFFKAIFHLPPTAIEPFVEAGFRVEVRSSTTIFIFQQKTANQFQDESVEAKNQSWKMYPPSDDPQQ